MTKKLQNYFNDFLPLNYREFKQSFPLLTSNQATVASLLRICCEEDDVKAIQIAFERIIGKPEKVIVIKRTLLKMIFPDAKAKTLTPPEPDLIEEPTAAVAITENKVVIDEADAPGALLKRRLDEIGEEHNTYAYEVLDNKDQYAVADVMVANLYGIAMRGSNLKAIEMLFNYLDGAVADVVRLEGLDTILLENYADVAPYDAKQDENGVWYVEMEGIK